MDDDVLDGNAVAGLLWEVFGAEMTDARHRCAHCGNQGALATLRVWNRGPGTVLRCSICASVVLRVTTTPHGRFVDASGVAMLRMPAEG